jgi:hypothetical protein
VGSRSAGGRPVRSRSDVGRLQLEEDFVLPDHFLPRGIATPERRLLLAVLEEAIGTYQRCVTTDDRSSRAILASVEQWFASEESASAFAFSFVGICDALGIEPTYVRTGLARWTGRHRPAAETRDRPLAHALGLPRSA